MQCLYYACIFHLVLQPCLNESDLLLHRHKKSEVISRKLWLKVRDVDTFIAQILIMFLSLFRKKTENTKPVENVNVIESPKDILEIKDTIYGKNIQVLT